jgi:hypothetical protein
MKGSKGKRANQNKEVAAGSRRETVAERLKEKGFSNGRYRRGIKKERVTRNG